MTDSTRLGGLRICIAYDGLFPWSIGGIERWYRALAEALAKAGAEVTYLTRAQWEEEPDIPGVTVIPVVGRQELYAEDGTRRTLQPIRFGIGVFSWLSRHRGEVDAVHLANFPYFSLIAARLALIGTRVPVQVDWFEVWPRRYWRVYAGALGRLGYAIQQTCIHLSVQAFVFWDHTALRLISHGFSGQLTVLPGLLPPMNSFRDEGGQFSANSPMVLFAGRHIRDKGVRLLPEALALARLKIPNLRLVVAGEGPETPLLHRMVAEMNVSDSVDFVGKVPDDTLQQLIASASCAVVASIREGYSLAVVEAAAFGTPSVVANNPENAATEHIIDGSNGFVVEPTPAGLADGFVRSVRGGSKLRVSTRRLFEERSGAMSLVQSTAEVVDFYVSLSPRPRTVPRP